MNESNATEQTRLYEQAVAVHGGAVARVARAYEAAPDGQADLRQEIHVALWRSFECFDGRCSLRTWVYRVAHNTAATHVLRQRRARTRELVGLDDLEIEPVQTPPDIERSLTLARLLALVQQLRPLDRQVISLYLEGESAAAIAEVTGLSAGHVAVKVHRIKALLGRQFTEGERHVNQASSR